MRKTAANRMNERSGCSSSSYGGSSAIIAVANLSGGNQSALIYNQMPFKTTNQHISKEDEIEIGESANVGDNAINYKNSTLSWICCAPFVWLRSSSTVHKIAITTATLLVTSLLVASPILYLISTAPSQLPKACYDVDTDCMTNFVSPLECNDLTCRKTSSMIQSNINWDWNPCTDFKQFSCSITRKSSPTLKRSPQDAVDYQMQRLLQHNTTSGPFRKLGRLFGSCLKQSINTSTIQYVLERLGGYLPIGALGPSSISSIISKMNEIGPTPLIDIYYDLSYGKRPHVLLIISSSTLFSPILESQIRWMGPKAAPYRINEGLPHLLEIFLESFFPSSLSFDQKESEVEAISSFIKKLNKIRVEHSRRGFWDSSVLYNTSVLQDLYPMLNWTNLLPSQWSGPIVVRSSEYMKAIGELLSKYPTRVAHNALITLFMLGVLPRDQPNPKVCTIATMWALPDITSALYLSQHSSNNLQDVIERTNTVFKSLKAHLKRAPSLKGAALVKLSALKIQSEPWPGFTNVTFIIKQLESLEISSDNWFENILKIFKRNKVLADSNHMEIDSHDAWAYPITAKVFYDTLSHTIVVPLSVVFVPYFDDKLPPYLHYASVGVAIAKEVLRSITKSFEEKAMLCVPTSVDVLPRDSRMDVLIFSGGMQISYHSMLTLTGPIKGMAKLQGLDLTPRQLFFLVVAQEFCAESEYAGVDTESKEFEQILGWLIAQGGSAAEAFKCPYGSVISSQMTCNVL